MAIKQSTLEKKWYYRMLKVLSIAIPSIMAALVVIHKIQQENITGIIYTTVVLMAYFLILKLVWRTFAYIIFGGIENDVKKESAKTAQQPKEQITSPTVASGSSAISEEDNKQIGFYLFILIMIGLIYYIYTYESPNQNYNYNNSENKQTCIPTGCGSLWRCDGTYYDLNGVQRSLHACLPNKAGETYASWSGTCRQCP